MDFGILVYYNELIKNVFLQPPEISNPCGPGPA